MPRFRPSYVVRLLRAPLLALAVLLAGLGAGLGAGLVSFLPVGTAPAWADGYLSALDDVPLMPGLAEVPDAGIEFEAATGRIVEAEATGVRRPGLDRAAVLKFYRATLPALGWRPVSATRFVREAEVLDLTVTEMPDRVTVHYGVKPR